MQYYRSVNMKTITTTQLGATIRVQRKALGVTQKDLAMASGTGLRFIIDLEKGKPTCQTGKMLQVLQALGLDLSVEDGAKRAPQRDAS
jgi:y4mF family transcriptional regulator